MPESSRIKRRFGITTLLALQLLLSPLFLSVLYANFNDRARREHPYTTIAVLLLPPTLYVSLLVAWRLSADSQKSRLLCGIRWGIYYGCIFFLLAWGPLGISKLVQEFPDYYAQTSFKFRWITAGQDFWFKTQWMLDEVGRWLPRFALLWSYVLLNYAVIGAACGALTELSFQSLLNLARSKPTRDSGQTLDQR